MSYELVDTPDTWHRTRMTILGIIVLFWMIYAGGCGLGSIHPIPHG